MVSRTNSFSSIPPSSPSVTSEQSSTQGIIRRGGVEYDATRLENSLQAFLGDLYGIKGLTFSVQGYRDKTSFKFDGKRFAVQPTLSFGGCALHSLLGQPNSDGKYQYPSACPGEGEVGVVSPRIASYLVKVFFFKTLREETEVIENRIRFLDARVEEAYCNCLYDLLFCEETDPLYKYCMKMGKGEKGDDGAIIFEKRTEIINIKKRDKPSVQDLDQHYKDLFLDPSALNRYEEVVCGDFQYHLSLNELKLASYVYKVPAQVLKQGVEGGIEPASELFDREESGCPPVYIFYDDRACHFSACRFCDEPIIIRPVTIPLAAHICSTESLPGDRPFSPTSPTADRQPPTLEGNLSPTPAAASLPSAPTADRQPPTLEGNLSPTPAAASSPSAPTADRQPPTYNRLTWKQTFLGYLVAPFIELFATLFAYLAALFTKRRESSSRYVF